MEDSNLWDELFNQSVPVFSYVVLSGASTATIANTIKEIEDRSD